MSRRAVSGEARVKRKGICFSCGKPQGDYRLSSSGPSGSGTARVGGQTVSFTYGGAPYVEGNCENCSDPDPRRRWKRWQRWRNLTSLGMSLIVMELFIGSFIVWGMMMTERRAIDHRGGFAPWIAFLGIFVSGCMLAAWTRSFRWLSAPLVVSLVGLLAYILEIAPKNLRLPVPEPALLAGSVAYNLIAVALLICVARKRFA